jgi:hypothetical protein
MLYYKIVGKVTKLKRKGENLKTNKMKSFARKTCNKAKERIIIK